MPLGSWTLLFIVTCFVAGAPAEDGSPAAPVSFDRDVRPILRKRCAGCHNAEKPRGELDVTSYAAVVSGGTTGKVVVTENLNESPLYTYASHLEEPYMPPNAPRIPQRELDLIRGWIEGGLLEKQGDAVPSPSGQAAGSAPGSPGGLGSPAITSRAFAITALAVHPSEPTLAVSGHKQVILFDLSTRKLLGALPFPEGDIFALRFSRDGHSLLAAGGVGAELGKAVLFETKGWIRTQSFGEELDAVLAADVSPDGTKVVLGGPNRVVKVFTNPGARAIHALHKSTDWITAAAVSPDGLLIAAGDRFGGLFVWETRTGQEFLTLRGHVKAVNATVWGASTDRLVTCGDDGSVRIWDLHSGKVASDWKAHDGAVLGLDVHAAGRIASVGGDRRVKIWDPEGNLVANFGPTTDQATRVAWAPDGRSVVSGDFSGEVRLWKLDDSTSIRLPIPVNEKPAAVALVEPVMTPAQMYVPKAIASSTMTRPAERPISKTAPTDDLSVALESAREAAAAAEKSVSRLSRLWQSRTRSSVGVPSQSVHSRRSEDALVAANAALSSLRAALEAAPGNPALARAVEETERAIRLLEDGNAHLSGSRPGNTD
jgi:WD40 repeat protein